MICVAPNCAEHDAATEFDVEAPEPAAEILCLDHYRALVKRRARAQETAALTRRRIEILSLPKMTCYGNGGQCPNEGAPYPGGPYCGEHSPDPFAAPAVKSHDAFADGPDDEETHEPVGEPMLKAVACPEDKMPGSVRAAVKRAVIHGWEYRVNLAIGPEGPADAVGDRSPVHSVAFLASKDDVRLSSRHEGAEIAVLRFKQAWHQTGNQLPISIGWRELTAALEGTDPNEADKRAMRQGVLDVMDIGGTVIEINATG